MQCSGYRCNIAMNTCATGCVLSSDCTEPYECTAGRCVMPERR
jgi:hypothetical protein